MTLSLKNAVNVPSKRNQHKNLLKTIWLVEGHRPKEQDPEPYSLVKGTDPRIRIRICTEKQITILSPKE
jgi:hypothetical protein